MAKRTYILDDDIGLALVAGPPTSGNSPPDAIDDAYVTRPGVAVTVAAPGLLANDTDANGDALTITSVDLTNTKGTLQAFADGRFTFTPTAGFVGLTSFKYSISDGFGGVDTATVQINVANATPDAVDDAYVTRPGVAVTVVAPGLLANDIDADGDALTITSVDLTNTKGTVQAFADGRFTFTPTAGFVGLTSFKYNISDGFGGVDAATVQINVANAAPNAVDDAYVTRPGVAVTVAAPGPLANDIDADGDALTITSVDLTNTKGTVQAFADGRFTFTPTAGFVGLTSFKYAISDGFGGVDTATVQINVANAAPDAVDDTYVTRPGVAVTVAAPGLLANDTDADGDALTITSVDLTNTKGTVQAFADGRFTFTPTAGFVGLTSFKYNISDGFGGTDTATVKINVVNRAPDAVDDSYIARLGDTLSMAAPGILGNDTDANADTLIVTSVDGTGLKGTLTQFGDGHFTFKPTAGFVGLTSFKYYISDGFGGTDSAAVTLKVVDLPVDINGTSANDTLTGTDSFDRISGLDGDDTLSGRISNDELYGGAGNDSLDGGVGGDKLTGGVGNDTYVVDNAGDVVTEIGGQGTDTVMASITYTLGASIEVLILTGSGNIDATGNSNNNALTGNDGNNSLNGGLGSDLMTGGLGDDTCYVNDAGDKVVELDGGGTDTVFAGMSYSGAGQYIENITLLGSGDFFLLGNGLGNTLRGNSGNNDLNGSGGADTMIGGGGSDTYTIDNAGDVVTETGSPGIDVVNSRVTFDIGTQYIEIVNLIFNGNANVYGSTTGRAETLNGNTAHNILDGRSGADTMAGGRGNDTYYVDNAGDLVTENTAEGTDLVNSYLTYSLGADLENLTLLGAGNLTGTGNALGNIITGAAGNNKLLGLDGNDWLDGGLGSDTLTGGLGNDTYSIDDAGDVTVDVSTGGTGDTVHASVSYALGASAYIEIFNLTGAANINATGNNIANSIAGNSGNNRLDGGNGADILTGGAGKDTLIGGSGADTFFFGLGSAQDVINDFKSSQNDLVNIHAYSNGVVNGGGVTLTAQGSNTLIDLGGGNTILVLNILPTDPDFLNHIVW